MPEKCRQLALVLLIAGPAMADVSDLGWMSGCWAATGREAGSVEQWTMPAGGTMFGVSRTVVEGKTVAFEYLRIVTDEEGGVALISSPSGQKTARFEVVKLSRQEVVFENREHDFPQRIIYSLTSDNNLDAYIEGTINGKWKRVDFPMTRISCGDNQVAR